MNEMEEKKYFENLAIFHELAGKYLIPFYCSDDINNEHYFNDFVFVVDYIPVTENNLQLLSAFGAWFHDSNFDADPFNTRETITETMFDEKYHTTKGMFIVIDSKLELGVKFRVGNNSNINEQMFEDNNINNYDFSLEYIIETLKDGVNQMSVLQQ